MEETRLSAHQMLEQVRAALEQFAMRGGVQLEIGVQVDCQLDAGPTWKYRMKLGWKMLK